MCMAAEPAGSYQAGSCMPSLSQQVAEALPCVYKSVQSDHMGVARSF